MRILVCGGRDFDDYKYLSKCIDKFCLDEGLCENEYLMPMGVTIISGMSRGADRLAVDWAVVNWANLEEYPADWNRHGRFAGPIRNQQMLNAEPDVVLAFPGGRGTEHMKQIAREKGVRVIEF